MPERVDLNRVVSNMMELLSKSLSPAISMVLNTTDNLPEVYLSSGDLQDSILNLVLNARDASDKNGTITLTTGIDLLEPQQTPHVYLSIRDEGCGIPEALIEKVFEPFFSTKIESKGSGLGLSMVYGFVQRSRGKIDIRSEPGQGTEIILYLPAHHPGEAAQAQ